jgi:hypothetical protein
VACTVHADIVRVLPARESPLYATIEIRLQNDGAQPCSVRRYRVHWPGGEADFEPRNLVVPPHATVMRTVRIMPVAGDVGRLLREPASGSVHIMQTSAA